MASFPLQKCCRSCRCVGSKDFEKCTKCTIISCGGAGCKLSHDDGRFIHCKDCNPEEHHYTRYNNPRLVDTSKLNLIDCKGNNCKIYYRGLGNLLDKQIVEDEREKLEKGEVMSGYRNFYRATHCVGCFPPLEGPLNRFWL